MSPRKPIQHGVKLLWADDPVPPLPDGWLVRRETYGVAVAIAPDGLEYLIGEHALYPWKVWGEDGLRPGKHYMDVKKKIPIPQ